MRKSLALLVLLATAVSPVQASPDPSVCARTEQVRDAIVALVPVSDCADVTDVHLADIRALDLLRSSIVTLQEGDFAGLTNIRRLYLRGNRGLTALPEGIFADLGRLLHLQLHNNSLTALPEGIFSGHVGLSSLRLDGNNLADLPGGIFSGLTALETLELEGNPGINSGGVFRPIADAGADQTAGAAQVVTLTATASDDDPWGDNVRYVWTRTDNSGSDLTLMDAETASPSFVMPAGATGLEFELRVTGRGGDHFVGTDSLKVRHPDAVVTLTGPEAAAPTTEIVEDSINLVYTYSYVDLHGRALVLEGKLEVTAAVDGVALIPDINIDEASGQGEITVVLRRQEYPGPIEHLLAVTLSLSDTEAGFVLGEPSSITTTFSFFSSVDPSVCARTEQVRDAIVASVPVSDCADVTDVHLADIGALNLSRRSIVTLQEGDFAGLTNLSQLLLSNNRLAALPAGVFSGLPALLFLNLNDNSLEALPAGVFSGLPALRFLYLDGNPGNEGFRPIADAGADQTAVAAQVVILTATASDDDPWGDNVRYVWTRIDNSGSELTLMDAETASPSFVMPAGATGLEFELRVTGRGGDPFVGTDSLKVRHPDAVVTLTGPEAAAPTTEIVEDSINLVYTYSYADLHGRALVLEGKLEVTAAVDGVALIPDINIDEASGQGEITVVLRRQEYPGPIEHLLAVTLSLSDTEAGFVLGEPSSITTPFSFFSSVDPSVCARTEQVRDAIVALVPVSHCADVTDVHLADLGALNLSRRSIVTLQEGDFAGLTNLSQLLLSNNRLAALPAGVFSGLPALLFLNLNDNSLEALPAGVFSGLPALRFLYLDGNPGSEGFRPIADAGADQTAVTAQVVILTATASEADPWGDNVRYVWTRIDNSGSDLTLMDAETASPSFVMPADATGLEFELRVTGRGGDHFVGTDSLKVRHPDAVVTLTAGPEPAATTTNIVEESISLVYTYSVADQSGRVLADKIEVTAAVDGVAIIPDINIDEARGQGEITVVLRRQEYPGPIGHLLAVTLRLSASAAAEGFVLGEPSSITTPFSFFSSVDSSVCARTEQVRDAIVALVPVSDCADVTDGDLADINILDLSGSSIETLQEGDFAGLTNLLQLELSNNSLEALLAGVFSGLPALTVLNLNDNSLEALPAGVFSELPTLRFLYLGDNSLTALPADVFAGLTALEGLNLGNNSLEALPAGVFSGLPTLKVLYLVDNSLTVLSADAFSDLPALALLELNRNSLEALPAGVFSELPTLRFLYLGNNSLTALPADVFADLPALEILNLGNNSLEALLAGAFSGLPALRVLHLSNNSLGSLPGGVFSGLTALETLELDGNPGSEGFRPIADAGANQTAAAAQVVTLMATASDDDPWGDNVRYVWTRTDNSGSSLTLMDAETAGPSFVMPAGATGLEFELRVTGRGLGRGDPFVGTDSLKVHYPAVVTLTGPEPAATTTNVVEDSISLVYTYSVADLRGRVLAGKLEVTAAVDGVAVIPDIHIDEASGQGEITVVLRRQEYPGPIRHLLAVTLRLGASAVAEGFVLGEPSSITTPFNFDPSVCARTEQVRDAIVASVPVSDCADVTDVHLADIGALNLSWRSIVTLQKGDFAGLTNLSQLLLSNNSLEALPAGIFSGLPALLFLNLNDNSLEALPAGVFSELPALRFLYLDGNPGNAGFRPIADAGADQTAVAAQVVALTATASDADPWGDNVRYVWTRTDNSGSELTLMDAETASPSFVMPAGATELEFELRVTGRGGDQFVGTDSLKVRYPYAVVTLSGPEPVVTRYVVEDSIRLVYTYSAADLYGRVLAGNIEVTAAVDGVAVTPTIKIDEARGHGEITVVLRRQEYPGPIGHLLAVTLSLSAGAAAEGFVLGEPSSITTPFRFVLPADPSVCDRTPQVRDVIVSYLGIHCADVTDGHLADLRSLILSARSIVTLQEGDFAGLTNLRALHLDDNSLEALPAGIFSGLPILEFLYLGGNSLTLTALPAGVFSGLPALSTLFLNDNSLTALPAGVFSGLPALNSLYLYGNNLMELPADAFSGLPRLINLSLSWNGLTALPGGVFAGLPDLRHLHLEGNNLMELSADVFSGLLSLEVLNLIGNSLTALPGGVFASLTDLKHLLLRRNNLMELSADVFSGLPSLKTLNLRDNNLMELSADIFSGLPALEFLYLNDNNLTALPGGVFAGLTDLERLYLSNNNLMELSADVFSGLSRLWLLDLYGNSLTALPGGVFAGLTKLEILYLNGNPGSEGFRPIANAGAADQTARAGQVVTLTATVSEDDPWGDNVRYVWTDNSGGDLTLMDAETASLSFVMPEGGTVLEFKLKVIGRGGDGFLKGYPRKVRIYYLLRARGTDYFFDTDTLKVRHPAVVTLTGPEPATTTTEIVENEFSLVFTYSAADLHGRVLAGKLEVTVAVDGVAVTPTININEASGQGEITVVLRRQEYPGPIGHLLAVTLSLSASAAAEGFVLGEPSSITTPFSFFSSVDSSVCARTEQVRDALVASVPVSHCADVTDVHLADIGALDLSWSSIVTLQEGDFAGLLALVFFDLSNNSLEALPAGVFSGLPALVLLDLSNNSLEALPAGVFSELPTLSLLYLDGNPGSEGFRPIADAGADQTAAAAQVVTLTATASGDDPWGDNVRYVWTRTDNSGSDLTLMDAETASPSFVMPAGATGLEFELRVTGRGGDHFVGTDSLKVRHPDPNAVVVTLTGPEPATTTTNIVEDSINLVYTYSAADLHGRVLAGKIEVAAAIDGVAVTPDINIDEASGQGEITVVLRRQEYPGPIGHVLAVTLSLSAGAAAEGFVLGEPSSITTPFRFRAVDGP